MIRPLLLHVLPILAGLLAPVLAEGQSASSPLPPVELKGIGPDPLLDPLFKPLSRGYLGADGAASVALDEERVLWVFGDTMLGNSFAGDRQGSMVRNSIAIQDTAGGMPGTVEYYWNLDDRLLGDFFHSGSWEDPHWYWPGAGVRYGETVYLFLTKLTGGEGDDGFAFETVDCTLFRVRNPDDHPDAWIFDSVDLGFGDQHFNINVAALVEGEHVYLLGYDDGPERLPSERYAFLARLPVEALEESAPGDHVEFWSQGGEWRSGHDALDPLFRPGTTESGLYYDEVIGRYVTATIEPFTPDVFLVTAEDLTGPWMVQKIYEIPGLLNRGDDNYHAYTPRVHPMLAPKAGVIVLTYVINTKDFWSMFSDLDIYYPRFVRLEVAP